VGLEGDEFQIWWRSRWIGIKVGLFGWHGHQGHLCLWYPLDQHALASRQCVLVFFFVQFLFSFPWHFFLLSSPLSSRIVWRFFWRARARACMLLRLFILGYSALDFTTLDPHWGRRSEWRSLIDAVHARGMYYIADFTVATMGDLIAWKG
jgi:hypothetical protein